MTDLEATRLCAEAMGKNPDLYVMPDLMGGYNPLHDDAQAMALVKKIGLRIYQTSAGPSNEPKWRAYKTGYGYDGVENETLNGAIVYCVAAMQEGRK